MLQDRVVVVSGAGGSIGECIVDTSLQEGAFVSYCDLKLNSKWQHNKRVFGKVCDVTKEAEVEDFVDSTVKHFFGKIDCLVNCVAAFVFGTIEEASSEDWDKVLSVNVKGYALLTKHVIKHMKTAKRGSIVHVSSQVAHIAQPCFTPYNTSKAAIEMLSKSIALDYGRYNIRSNTVCPGTIKTKATQGHADKVGKTVEQLERDVSKELMLGRLGLPEEVAQCVLFLLSDMASYVTASYVLVDGGNVAK